MCKILSTPVNNFKSTQMETVANFSNNHFNFSNHKKTWTSFVITLPKTAGQVLLLPLL
ncbi:hypothetical protein Hanom_Chr16g01506921 [Helianthus anomalus]